MYLGLKETYFQHIYMMLQKDALKYVVFVKKMKLKLPDLRGVEEISEFLITAQSNIAPWYVLFINI